MKFKHYNDIPFSKINLNTFSIFNFFKRPPSPISFCLKIVNLDYSNISNAFIEVLLMREQFLSYIYI